VSAGKETCSNTVKVGYWEKKKINGRQRKKERKKKEKKVGRKKEHSSG
jgi:hypothetical protein